MPTTVPAESSRWSRLLDLRPKLKEAQSGSHLAPKSLPQSPGRRGFLSAKGAEGEWWVSRGGLAGEQSGGLFGRRYLISELTLI
jgi:hypothetical protein